jgi:dipeptidyl aminopeptidase/acylaminoacyl peptidase
MRTIVLSVLLVALASCSREESAAVPRLPMQFPARPNPMLLNGQVQLFDVTLTGSAPGQTMRLWVYLPAGSHREKSLPCVLIAPAGSNLITGMKLGEGDRPEHLPYTAAGFAVIAYELDGALPDGADSDAAVLGPYKSYVAAKGGVLNAQTAIDYAAARVPEIDMTHIYTAGQSSAGTVALVVAASEPRVKGAVAYAPGVSLTEHLGPEMVRSLNQEVRPSADFLTFGSPDQRVADIKCPVMLFAAWDDQTVKAQTVADFAQTLKSAGKTAEFVAVNTGGHYDAMMQQGIPAGIAWLKKIDKP